MIFTQGYAESKCHILRSKYAIYGYEPSELGEWFHHPLGGPTLLRYPVPNVRIKSCMDKEFGAPFDSKSIADRAEELGTIRREHIERLLDELSASLSDITKDGKKSWAYNIDYFIVQSLIWSGIAFIVYAIIKAGY